MGVEPTEPPAGVVGVGRVVHLAQQLLGQVGGARLAIGTPDLDTVTYDTYGHLFPERDAEITDGLESLLQRGVDFPWTRSAAVAATESEN